MDFEFSRLSWLAIILCGGGILLLVLIAVAVRSLFANRSNPRGRQDENIWRDRGQERPQYDSDRIESSGGFGNAPSQRSARPDRDREERQAGFGSQQARSKRPPRRERDQDDDVQSRGGFGG